MIVDGRRVQRRRLRNERPFSRPSGAVACCPVNPVVPLAKPRCTTGSYEAGQGESSIFMFFWSGGLEVGCLALRNTVSRLILGQRRARGGAGERLLSSSLAPIRTGLQTVHLARTGGKDQSGGRSF